MMYAAAPALMAIMRMSNRNDHAGSGRGFLTNVARDLGHFKICNWDFGILYAETNTYSLIASRLSACYISCARHEHSHRRKPCTMRPFVRDRGLACPRRAGGGDRNSPASSENAMFVAIPAGEHMASGPLF